MYPSVMLTGKTNLIHFLLFRCMIFSVMASADSEMNDKGFQIGTQYLYDYGTTLILNRLSAPTGSSNESKPNVNQPRSGRDLFMTLRMKLNVIPIWQSPGNKQEKLIKFRVS